MKKIEVILPCFNEELNIPIVHDKILEATAGSIHNFNITFIDDGSTDKTWEVINHLCKKNKTTNGIRLSRNFGHQAAIEAGLKNVTDASVIIMDADMQDNPSYIKDLVSKWEKGNQVVLAKRIDRNESYFRKKIFSLFFYMQNKMTDIEIPKNVGHFSFLDEAVVQKINLFPEKLSYLNGLRSYVGFQTDFIEVIKEKRLHGSTQMTYRKLFSLGMNGIFSFSSKPLILIGLVGVLISIGSLIVSAYSLYHKIRYGRTILGWDFGLSSIYFLSGIQILSLSIIGNYIGNIFNEVKKRPNYIISETTNY